MPARIYRILLYACLFAFSSAVHATTYYVRNDGDDSADGRSHDTAWATIDKVNAHPFEPGDSVLFLEGDSWTGKVLEVDWSGTDSEHVVIGAYHVVDGQEQRGFETQRPVIDGADKVPSQFGGLITVSGDRVRIENLDVANSRGRGVEFRGSDRPEIVNLHVSGTFNSGIKTIESSDGLIENNYVVSTGEGIHSGEDWGGAIAALDSPRTVIRRNKVSRVFGEGINVNHGSADCVIEENEVYAARSAGIYVDSSPGVTVRRNIIAGTSDSKYWRYKDTKTVGGGIVLNNERYHYESGSTLKPEVQARDVKIYANLVAYTHQGIAFWGQYAQTSFDNVKIYNNTLVDNDFQVDFGEHPKQGSEFVNNILLSLSPGTKDVASTALAGMSARFNYFSQGDPGGDFSHPGNQYQGLELMRMEGWRTISDFSQVKWQYFQPKGEAVTIGAGDDSLLALATELDDFDKDWNGKAYNRPVDMGALRFSSEANAKVPGSPGSFRARVISR